MTGYTLALAGRLDETRKILERLSEWAHARHVPAFCFTLAYTGLGEIEPAFEWLEKAYRDREEAMVWLKALPEVEPLRSDPLFDDLLRRIGFPAVT